MEPAVDKLEALVIINFIFNFFYHFADQTNIWSALYHNFAVQLIRFGFYGGTKVCLFRSVLAPNTKFNKNIVQTVLNEDIPWLSIQNLT